MVKIGEIDDAKRARGKPRAARARARRDESAAVDFDERRGARRFAALTGAELKARVDSAGRDFMAGPSDERLTEYRDLLREVIERAVTDGLAIAGERKYAPDPKTFSVITRINADIIELTEEIRRAEFDRIRIGRLIDELKGLVADLLG